jgi:glycosyltransferase involved in cell wall biosynthesis
VIFPSFYEGFGLPVVNALAYGKTVVTRDTELLREVADVYTGPGRIVPFTTPDELVERLASLRHGLPVPELTLNRAPAPANWASAAAVVDDALRALVNPRGVRRERDRHELISLLDAWKSD